MKNENWYDKNLWGRYVYPKLRKIGWTEKSIRKLVWINLAIPFILLTLGILLL